MNSIIGFLTGFVSWNALAWLVTATILLVGIRLFAKLRPFDVRETGTLFYGVAMMIALVSIFMHYFSQGIFSPAESDNWLDTIISQFTAQSILINLAALILHRLLPTGLPKKSETES
jgi:hypothetical protein